jgi:hypothetical protein
MKTHPFGRQILAFGRLPPEIEMAHYFVTEPAREPAEGVETVPEVRRAADEMRKRAAAPDAELAEKAVK